MIAAFVGSSNGHIEPAAELLGHISPRPPGEDSLCIRALYLVSTQRKPKVGLERSPAASGVFRQTDGQFTGEICDKSHCDYL